MLLIHKQDAYLRPTSIVMRRGGFNKSIWSHQTKIQIELCFKTWIQSVEAKFKSKWWWWCWWQLWCSTGGGRGMEVMVVLVEGRRGVEVLKKKAWKVSSGFLWVRRYVVFKRLCHVLTSTKRWHKSF